ncbi:hypothetical protein B0H63DRAFT_444874 [Podospora didyma]|uniref:Homeobox domain-containing protein n=1 Tax=Podospora didyma TaxID=330526 RepID=A0AAE0U8D6_9PEZI|nr:hypothetical protein B0H63DRAFT_444874 [Podospora didyma]
MEMDMMDLYRRPYSNLNMQHFSAPQHGQPHGQQYPFWNQHLMAFYQQQQQRATAAMMGQGSMHSSKQTEPKPRLAKDEVELLEREFAKNPKPNSSTKRQLAERMNVEVPRINNWFQNRRAKEKQMKKTAEFEAQQAKDRASSDSKPSDDQGPVSEFYGLSNLHRPLGLSTAAFGEDDEEDDEDDEADAEGGEDEFHRRPSNFGGLVDLAASAPPVRAIGTPASSDSDGFVHVEYEPSSSPPHHGQRIIELAPPPAISGSFAPIQDHQADFQRSVPYLYGLPEPPAVHGLPEPCFDGMPSHRGVIHGPGPFIPFADRDYFAPTPVPQFPSQLIAENAARSANHEAPVHRGLTEDLVKEEDLSPSAMPDSPPLAPDMRFKSPPPPADIAGRRNMRRPAPLGLSSLRSASHCAGPKTGIDAPRRADTASPLRRISSATGSLSGRVQKSMLLGGPRSPFNLDRNKEALYQSLQGTHSPVMASLNGAMSPMASDGINGQGVRENTVATNSSDEEQSYTFGSLGAVSGLPMYKSEPNAKTPPTTPGLPIGFQDPFYPPSAEHGWNYGQHDEALPTPSLCSHGGSELEFSMAPQMPGYVASQPVTPSFPPSVGPTYTGFFGGSLANTEYTFPDSYPPESSARSSPGGPPKCKQFQFAQNVTPQDYNTDK